MKKLLLIVFAFLSSLPQLQAKLLVITHVYNRPDFIELQDKTFREFLQDDYEFVVFNDGKDRKISYEIQTICAKLNIRCIPIPQDIHTRPYLPRVPGELYDHPCVKCANVVQYSLDTLGFDHDGLVMIIDSDMFLIKDLNVAKYMQNCDISGHFQNRGKIEYLWNGILFFNMNTLPSKKEISFNSGRIEGEPCDVGGYTYYYLKNHPEARTQFLNQVHVETHTKEERGKFPAFLNLMTEENVPNSEFFMDCTFFHYRGDGNRDYKSTEYHSHKTAALHKLIDLALRIKRGS